MNRVYISPSPIDHPSIYAAKTYLEYLHFRLGYVFMYLDLHAHSSKKGAFLFGNCLDIERQVENQTFAKLLNLNSEYFSFSDCDFSERSMHSKSLHDPCTKEGSGRVANYRSTNLTFCYTVEACY